MMLEGKSIVVTGAARGIGRAVARRMGAEGAGVVCVDVAAEGTEETASLIDEAGGRARPLVADIATKEGNQDAVREAERAFGGLDAFHANAAVQFMGSAEELTESEWDSLHRVNLKGPYFGIQAALPALRARGGGAIILTASLLGIVGDPLLAGYGAMKGGLRSLARAIATAHGHENIRCNTICPGDVETDLLADFIAEQPDPMTARKELTSHYPLGRFASPDDVSGVAAFLASDDASYLSGIDIVVDGGLLARIY